MKNTSYNLINRHHGKRGHPLKGSCQEIDYFIKGKTIFPLEKVNASRLLRHSDQLLIPMALAGGGCFRTAEPNSHAVTNIEVIKKFLDIDMTLAQQKDLTWEVAI